MEHLLLSLFIIVVGLVLYMKIYKYVYYYTYRKESKYNMDMHLNNLKKLKQPKQ